VKTAPLGASGCNPKAAVEASPAANELADDLEIETQATVERIDARLERIRLLLGSPVRRWWKRSAR
jgi:hypothetical protein